jgi:hypothetical protein
MLVLIRSLLIREYILTYVLKALALYFSYRKLHRDTLHYLQWNISSILYMMGLRWSPTAKKINPLVLSSFILIFHAHNNSPLS